MLQTHLHSLVSPHLSSHATTVSLADRQHSHGQLRKLTTQRGSRYASQLTGPLAYHGMILSLQTYAPATRARFRDRAAGSTTQVGSSTLSGLARGPVDKGDDPFAEDR